MLVQKCSLMLSLLAKLFAMKIYCLLLCFIILGSSANAQNKDDSIVLKTLAKQAEAWNRGDLNGFMDTYWRSDSLMFVGKAGVTYGWQATLKQYQKNYPDTAAMGQLNFVPIQLKRLSVLYYSLTGKWHLTRTIGDLQGHFTLLLKRVKNKWVIVLDHSS